MTLPASAAIVTTPPGSGLGTPTNTSFNDVIADLTQLWTTPGQVLFAAATPTLTYAGASAAANSMLYLDAGVLRGQASNANTSAIISPFNINIGSDNVDTTTIGPGNLVHFSVRSAVSGSHTGGREAFQSYLNVVGTPAIAPGAAGYVGGQHQVRVNSNLTGTAGAVTNYKGNCFAANANAMAQSGATFLGLLVAEEFDVSVATGASVASKAGITVVQTNADSVRGVYDDFAIGVGNQQSSGTTWTAGLQFGSYSGKWAFGADSTLIFAQQRQVGPASASIALYGVDFRLCTFQSGGAAFISTGFQVDPNGNTSVATEAVTGKQVLNNNAVGTYTFPANSSYVGFTGTNATTIAFTLPAAAAAIDGRIITVFTHAAVSVSSTWASAGATFVDAPATLAAGSVTRFIYDHASLQWLRA